MARFSLYILVAMLASQLASAGSVWARDAGAELKSNVVIRSLSAERLSKRTRRVDPQVLLRSVKSVERDVSAVPIIQPWKPVDKVRLFDRDFPSKRCGTPMLRPCETRKEMDSLIENAKQEIIEKSIEGIYDEIPEDYSGKKFKPLLVVVAVVAIGYLLWDFLLALFFSDSLDAHVASEGIIPKEGARTFETLSNYEPLVVVEQ